MENASDLYLAKIPVLIYNSAVMCAFLVGSVLLLVGNGSDSFEGSCWLHTGSERGVAVPWHRAPNSCCDGQDTAKKNPQLSGKQFHINRPTYFMLTLKFNVITPARSRGNKASWEEGWNEALWQDGEVLWPSARGEAVITHHRASREAEDLFSPQINPQI